MQKHLFLFLFLVTFLTKSSAQQRITNQPAYKKGEVLVQLDKEVSFKKIEEEFTSIEFTRYKLISRPANIWKVSFNEEEFFNKEIIDQLGSSRFVQLVQNNHFVELRSSSSFEAPDDPQYQNQWHHKNTGQTGGTPGADISSEGAWEVTTGGLTITGDDIVVCIIESADLSHEDLVANRWVNSAESPAPDGIDTDDNGYVDDFFGWNIAQNNDNTGMQPSGHGTSVAGMIGAVGNNDIGLVGANWDVKMMVVAGHSTLESDVIEAYTYPLVQREIFNETNGTQGAFVVATNASWGVDGGDPENAPIWCNFYDILGAEGILNCGATSNSNVNVDNVGDLPTACESEFMIGVGRSDHNDNFAGGFGVSTIDLVAPGIQVATTSNGDNYTVTTGTSFASPLTAGVIGLLYSVPCPSLMNIAYSDPQMAASIVKDAILLTVDQKPQLEDFFVTGGRLNAEAAVNYLMDNFCVDDSCLPVFNVEVTEITDSDALFSWLEFDEDDEYEIHYRVTDTEEWTIVASEDPEFLVEELEACQAYEYFIRSFCEEDDNDEEDLDGEDNLDFNDTEIEQFETDGCCDSPLIESIEVVNNDQIEIVWESILAAESYSLRYRILDEQTTDDENWTLIEGIEESSFIIEELAECEIYEVQIKTQCEEESIDFSESSEFTSTGCGICFSDVYCESFATDNVDEWIQTFSINSIENDSGNDDGYANFEDDFGIVLQPGETYSIELTPGFGGGEFDQYFRIWIDLNQNGEFEESDLVFDAGSPTTSTINESIEIPEDAVFGTTRMRVSMKYFSEGFFPSPPPEACEEFVYGEVEEYCVTIEPNCNLEFDSFVQNAGCESTLGNIELVFEDEEDLDIEVNWDNGMSGQFIQDLEAGEYTATIIDTNTGCTEVTTFTVEEVESIVDFDFEIFIGINLAEAEFTNLSTSAGEEQFEWDFGNGQTSNEKEPMFVYFEEGTFEVCLTMTDDCGTQEVCKEIVIDNLSVSEFNKNPNIEVYPNPASDLVNFKSRQQLIHEINIYDLNGKLINKSNPKQLESKVNISGFSNGVYLFVCKDKDLNTLEVGKLIIKN